MNTNNEGRNLEEINEKKILNFGDLSRNQKNILGLDVNGDEAGIKCERCNERIKARGKNSEGGIGDWKVYLKKTQVGKNKHGYYIDGAIKFYCPDCDRRYNYLER